MASQDHDDKKQPDYGDAIDPATFEQILEMDDDDDDSEGGFSYSIVFGFFEQAEDTFEKMEEALKEEDLKTLSSLGHFLKGSSATLGMTKVQAGCEKIQHYGDGQDASGEPDDETDKQKLQKIKETLKVVRDDYADAEKRLRLFYK